MGILQNFIDKVGPAVSAAWLNGVDIVVNSILGGATTNAQARNSLMSDAPLEINNGGTGARTITDAQNNLELPLYINGLLTQQLFGSILYPQTAAESAAGVTLVNFVYVSGHAYRYGTNTTPGTTDMTAAINAAANVARAAGGNLVVQIPCESKLLVSASLNFTNCRVLGLGSSCGFNGGIYASQSVQFDVITSTGGTIIDDLFVDGGWDQVTTGLVGDILSLKTISPAHPYVNSFSNCTFVNAKQRGIYIERGGYTSLFHMRVLTVGLHALECFGSNTDACTSIRDYGASQYGGTPNGYGIKLTNTAAMIFQGTICEATNGISLNGAIFNNAITFDGIYQEFNPTPSFTAKIDNGSGGAGNILTVTAPATLAGLGVGSVPTGGSGTAVIINQLTGNPGSTGTYTLSGGTQNVGSTAMTAPPIPFIDNAGGSALTIRGSYFAVGGFPFAPGIQVFQNWLNVYFQGNKFIGGNQGPIPFGNRIATNSVNAFPTTTSDITSGQLTLAPGTYRLWGTAQTIVNSGAGSITQLACQITTNSGASGLNNGTGGSLAEAADQTSSFGTQQDGRVKCFTEVQVFTSTIYYLRVHVTLSGVITIGCTGLLRAELIE